jgi:hypothetical protein
LGPHAGRGEGPRRHSPSRSHRRDCRGRRSTCHVAALAGVRKTICSGIPGSRANPDQRHRRIPRKPGSRLAHGGYSCSTAPCWRPPVPRGQPAEVEESVGDLGSTCHDAAAAATPKPYIGSLKHTPPQVGHGFLDLSSGGLSCPGGPGNPSKGWGASPPTFWKAFPGPRGS